MTTARKGRLKGNTIILDRSIPPLEGKRVTVRVEAAEEGEEILSAVSQSELWQAWAESGPQGPIEDDGEPELP